MRWYNPFVLSDTQAHTVFTTKTRTKTMRVTVTMNSTSTSVHVDSFLQLSSHTVAILGYTDQIDTEKHTHFTNNAWCVLVLSASLQNDSLDLREIVELDDVTIEDQHLELGYKEALRTYCTECISLLQTEHDENAQ